MINQPIKQPNEQFYAIIAMKQCSQLPNVLCLKNVCPLSYSGYKQEIFKEGDSLVVVHSHELHPPALPRKCISLAY